MRRLGGVVLIIFGLMNATREFAGLGDLPEGTDISFIIGLFLPSVLVITAGIYLAVTNKKR